MPLDGGEATCVKALHAPVRKADLTYAGGKYARQDAPVAAQDPVCLRHRTRLAAILTVVICRAAVV